jgi:hypothetical protein
MVLMCPVNSNSGIKSSFFVAPQTSYRPNQFERALMNLARIDQVDAAMLEKDISCQVVQIDAMIAWSNNFIGDMLVDGRNGRT